MSRKSFSTGRNFIFCYKWNKNLDKKALFKFLTLEEAEEAYGPLILEGGHLLWSVELDHKGNVRIKHYNRSEDEEELPDSLKSEIPKTAEEFDKKEKEYLNGLVTT